MDYSEFVSTQTAAEESSELLTRTKRTAMHPPKNQGEIPKASDSPLGRWPPRSKRMTSQVQPETSTKENEERPCDLTVTGGGSDAQSA